MNRKDEWQTIKGDPELLEAERARLRELYAKNREKERARSRAKYAANPEYYKKKHKEWWAKHPGKWNEYAAKKRIENGERERARDREWYAKNKESVAAKGRWYRQGPSREKYLKALRYAPHKHYLPREKYEELYPRLAEGPCEICGVKGKMKIDHCHERLIFRGIICDGCNRGLGFFKENPFTMIAAIKYLERTA